MTNSQNVPRHKRSGPGLNIGALRAELAGGGRKRTCRCEGELRCVPHYLELSGPERTAYRRAHGGPLSGRRPS